MDEIKHPHNNFFVKTFSDVANVADFVRGALPAELVRNMDVKSAYIEPTSFVEDSLADHLSDFVIKLKAKDRKRDFDLYLLFEHKSYMDENILWQLLKYQYLMIEEDHKAKRKFRTIIPIVFYHGHSKWKIAKSFSRSVNTPEYLKKYTLNFEYILFDTKDFNLSQNKKFGANAYLMSAISLLKESGKMDQEKLRTVLKYIRKSELSKNKESITIFMRYIVNTNLVDVKEVVNIMKSELGDGSEDIMPSLGRNIFNSGKEEGVLLGKVETCKKALLKGLDLQTIIELTGLPVEKVLEIQKSLSK